MMSASSQYRKVAEIQKIKKVERRNASNERLKPKDNIEKHIEVEERGVSPESISSDSVVISEEAPKPKKRGNSKSVFSNRKATKV
tara:strand:+ start:4096 stop:4350 length:255 start_codon:yes stop_codon:yes gene_type:complete